MDTGLLQAEIIVWCSKHAAEIKKYIGFPDIKNITEDQWLNLKPKDTVSVSVERSKKRNLSRLLIFLSVAFIRHGHYKKECKNIRDEFACLRFSVVKEGSWAHYRKQCVQDDCQFCSFCTVSHLDLILQSVKPIRVSLLAQSDHDLWTSVWNQTTGRELLSGKMPTKTHYSIANFQPFRRTFFIQNRLFQTEVPVGYGASSRRIVLGLQKWTN